MKTILIFGENEYLSTWNCFYTAVRICLYILRSRISNYVQFRWGLKVAALGTTKSYLTSHWATNTTMFTKFGFKSFLFWPIKGGFHFCWQWKKGILLLDPCQISQKLHLLTFEISVAGQIWFQQCVKSTKYKRLIRIIYLSNSFWDLPI